MKANKKNICKKVMACGLALSMMAPVTSFAAVQQSSEITGDNTVETGIFNVVLPTEVTFAIDPMELLNQAADKATKSNHIASTNLNIINQSNYAIQVDTYASLKLNADVKLKDDVDDVNKNSTDKLLYLGISSLETATPTTTDGVTTIVPVYNIAKIDKDADAAKAKNKAVAEKPSTTESYKYDTKVSCVLDKVNYANDAPADPAISNVAGLVFYGQVNTRASWADADITANIVFDIHGLSGNDYTAAVATAKADTQNVTALVDASKPTLPIVKTAVSHSSADKQVSIVYQQDGKSKATRVVDATVIDKDGNDLGTLPAGSFISEYDGAVTSPDTPTIKFVAGKGILDDESMKAVYDTYLKEDFIITVTFDDGMTTTIKIPAAS